MKISGIYQIQSKSKPGRIYIGSSKDIYKRWESHLRNLKKDKHHSDKLQRHYNKYGTADLQFSILVGCPVDDLIKTEQYFIDAHNPYFNGSKTAASPVTFKLSDEAKKKISEAFKGEKNPNYGRKFSEEHRRRMSESMKGRPGYNLGKHLSEETKRKISEAHKGKKNPHSGNIVSEETRKKLSESLKGRVPWNKGIPCSEQAKQKLKEYRTGRPHPNKPHPQSEETRKKISEAKIKYYRELKSINLN